MQVPPASARHAEFLSLGAAELALGISQGQFSCAEVCQSFIERCQEVQGPLRALSVPLFDEALAAAAALDRRRAAGDTLGPLSGIPLSVKECFFLRGTPSTMGLKRLAGQNQAHDAPLVAALRNAGCLPLGKTNVPQLMAVHECVNPLYGRTRNPWNLERTCGGSSGGDAALLAAGGALLGLGSDLGGSIRVPAHFCGVHGFKPTPRRLTRRGSLANFRGMQAMEFQPGPLARRVADLRLAYHLLLHAPENLADPEVQLRGAEIRPADGVRGLRIGVFADDGFFRPAAEVRRVVDEAAAALAAAGAVIEPFVPPRMPEPILLYAALLTADGGADLRQLLGNERPEPEVRQMLRLMGMPRWTRRPLAWLLRLIGQARSALSLENTGPVSAAAYWRLSHARTEYEREFFQELQRRQLAALVFPPHALPALRHGQSVELSGAAGYSFLANVLGMPAGVVAASSVRAGHETQARPPRDWVERAAASAENASAGLPLGVQVAAWPNDEELVFTIMEILEGHFAASPEWPLHAAACTPPSA